jgi:DNA-binding response OmpR family regulator
MNQFNFPIGKQGLRRGTSPGGCRQPVLGMHEIVVVDSACDQYGDFVQAAQEAAFGLHFCVDGRSAVRLARRFRADVWMIAAELPDMSGFDLVEMLVPHVLQGSVDPLKGGAAISLDRVGRGMRSGIFIVADTYRLEDEQRALAAGVAGYLVRPVTLDVIRASRIPAVAGVDMSNAEVS